MFLTSQDLRDPDSGRKYYKHNAPVTAAVFSPDDPHAFVVGTEAGGLFRYDHRVPNKAIGKVWGAHGSKPVTDLKWKPPNEEYGPVSPGKGWLASAGGDRTVQVRIQQEPLLMAGLGHGSGVGQVRFSDTYPSHGPSCTIH